MMSSGCCGRGPVYECCKDADPERRIRHLEARLRDMTARAEQAEAELTRLREALFTSKPDFAERFAECESETPVPVDEYLSGLTQENPDEPR